MVEGKITPCFYCPEITTSAPYQADSWIVWEGTYIDAGETKWPEWFWRCKMQRFLVILGRRKAVWDQIYMLRRKGKTRIDT